MIPGGQGEAAARRPGIAVLERRLGSVVDYAAGALVVADIVVLFMGVLARFVFHAPLIWSDELASILFIWMAMLGSVVALRRGEHMRMTALVSMQPPSRQPLFEAIALVAALAFLAMVAWPSWEYASEERFITTPALDISNAWRAAALPVGIALMALFAVLRLLRDVEWRVTVTAAVIIGVLIVGFALGRSVFQELGRLNLLVFFVVVVLAGVLSGIPIAFSFGLGTFGYMALATNTALPVIVGRMDEGMSHLILLAVPLFVFLGLLIEMTGMAKAMIAARIWSALLKPRSRASPAVTASTIASKIRLRITMRPMSSAPSLFQTPSTTAPEKAV